MEEHVLKAKDGYKLDLGIFPVENPRGCVQIMHGMEEHKARYARLAERLNGAGYAVVASDMRGHGDKTPVPGFFKEKDGYRYLLSDQKRITNYIRMRFGVEKVLIFAHSMGTIIARNLLQTESQNYEKVVLSGYPYSPGKPVCVFGVCICNLAAAIFGPQHDSKFVAGLVTGNFNKSIPEPKTEVDWISYNEENVRAYMEDPLCGRRFRVSANRDLLQMVFNMSCAGRYRNVNAELPIFLMRGDADPCTGFDKGAAASENTLKKAGFRNIRTKVYPHMRHELLNELEGDRVIDDMIQFYQA